MRSASVLWALLALASCGGPKEAPLPPPQGGQLTIEPAEWDFGTVPVGELVDTTFTLRNTGNGPLTMRKEVRVAVLEGC